MLIKFSLFYIRTFGIDLIVGGHSHSLLIKDEANPERVGTFPTPAKNLQNQTTWIVQAHRYGKYVGKNFYFNKKIFFLLTDSQFEIPLPYIFFFLKSKKKINNVLYYRFSGPCVGSR